MRRGGLEASRVELLSQQEERFRPFAEKVDAEDVLGSLQVVLLQVVVQSGPGRPEIRDPSRGGDPGSRHHDDVLGLAGLDVGDDPGKTDFVQNLR